MKKEEYKLIYEFEQKYWWYRALHELVLKIIQKKFNHKKLKILDAGCGTGELLSKLQNFEYTEGVDYSEEAIFYCKQRGLTNVSIQDLNLWKTDNRYNIIISLDVLYHTAIEDDLLIIDKFNSFLEKNGTIILNLPAFSFLKRNHDIIVFHQKTIQIKRIFKRTGKKRF